MRLCTMYYDFMKTVFPRRKLYTRSFTDFVKKNLTGSLVGAEIGVFKGHNSLNLLHTLDIKMLYLIDPYCLYEQHDEIHHFTKERRMAHRLLKDFDNVRFIEKKSVYAISEIPDQLDFVYIDGDHEYDTVKKDIDLYYQKVRSGGVLGGHDFNIKHKGVPKAVLDFVKKTKHNLYGENTDWWIIKK